MGPTRESFTRILRYLKNEYPSFQVINGNRSAQRNKYVSSFLRATLTVEDAESLFGGDQRSIRFYYYLHKQEQFSIVRAKGEIQLPNEIDQDIEYVSGVVDFPWSPSMRRKVTITHPPSTIKKKKKDNSIANNAPMIMDITGLDNGIILEFIPYCKDGSHPNTIEEPCQLNPPVIKGIYNIII